MDVVILVTSSLTSIPSHNPTNKDSFRSSAYLYLDICHSLTTSRLAYWTIPLLFVDRFGCSLRVCHLEFDKDGWRSENVRYRWQDGFKFKEIFKRELSFCGPCCGRCNLIIKCSNIFVFTHNKLIMVKYWRILMVRLLICIG